jgi:hypothetical protein
MGQEFKDQHGQQLERKRYQRARILAYVGLFLIFTGSDASAYVTSSTFFIDGGLTRNTGGL